MPRLIKKENIVISTGTYQKDGAEKHRYKTIGELLTMEGDDGSQYQFGEMWGPTGSQKFNVYEQQDRNQQGQQSGQPQQQRQVPQQRQYSQPANNQGNAPQQGQQQGQQFAASDEFNDSIPF